METVKQNVRIAEQKKRIKAYQEALEQKAGKHEADKTGKRDSHLTSTKRRILRKYIPAIPT